MSGRIEHEDGMIPNLLYSGSNVSSFACDQCKKKKVKCDKVAPRCGHCQRLNRVCDYPTAVPKPGPKAGSIRRRRSSSAKSHPVADREARCSSGNSSSHDEAAYEHAMTMVHPSHNLAEPSKWERQKQLAGGEGGHLDRALSDLGISREQCSRMIKTFFTNMTSFSLFHQPTFMEKLNAIRSAKEVQALVLAMAAFTQNFEDCGIRPRKTDRNLWDMAYRLTRNCLEDCEDDPPPLNVLQTFILVTWQKVFQGVRGTAFRLTGECVRLAYELGLNRELATDATSKWMEREEQRRAWWACWELDTFTSTMKRTPCVIEWSTNRTLLPMSDMRWFGGTGSASTPLHVDPDERWKELLKSENNSASAWFILFNSFKMDVHFLTMSPELSVKSRASAADGPKSAAVHAEALADIERRRQILIRCVRSAQANLPQYLSVQNTSLSFKPNERSRDAGRYIIHMLTQVTFFMLYRLDVFRAIPSKHRRSREADIASPATVATDDTHHTSTTPAHTPPNNSSIYDYSTKRHYSKPQRGGVGGGGDTASIISGGSSSGGSGSSGGGSRDRSLSWKHFLSSAEEVSKLIQNCPEDHIRYVNPCVANSVWFAASALVVGRKLGPPDIDQQLITSNFELLGRTLRQFIRIWNCPRMLVDRFVVLETLFAQLANNNGKRENASVKREDVPENKTSDAPPPAKRNRSSVRGQRTKMSPRPSLDHLIMSSSGTVASLPGAFQDINTALASSGRSSPPNIDGMNISHMPTPTGSKNPSPMPPENNVNTPTATIGSVTTPTASITSPAFSMEKSQMMGMAGADGFAGNMMHMQPAFHQQPHPQYRQMMPGINPGSNMMVDYEQMRDIDLNVFLNSGGDLDFDFDFFDCPFE